MTRIQSHDTHSLTWHALTHMKHTQSHDTHSITWHTLNHMTHTHSHETHSITWHAFNHMTHTQSHDTQTYSEVACQVLRGGCVNLLPLSSPTKSWKPCFQIAAVAQWAESHSPTDLEFQASSSTCLSSGANHNTQEQPFAKLHQRVYSLHVCIQMCAYTCVCACVCVHVCVCACVCVCVCVLYIIAEIFYTPPLNWTLSNHDDKRMHQGQGDWWVLYQGKVIGEYFFKHSSSYRLNQDCL